MSDNINTSTCRSADTVRSSPVPWAQRLAVNCSGKQNGGQFRLHFREGSQAILNDGASGHGASLS